MQCCLCDAVSKEILNLNEFMNDRHESKTCWNAGDKGVPSTCHSSKRGRWTPPWYNLGPRPGSLLLEERLHEEWNQIWWTYDHKCHSGYRLQYLESKRGESISYALCVNKKAKTASRLQWAEVSWLQITFKTRIFWGWMGQDRKAQDSTERDWNGAWLA